MIRPADMLKATVFTAYMITIMAFAFMAQDKADAHQQMIERV